MVYVGESPSRGGEFTQQISWAYGLSARNLSFTAFCSCRNAGKHFFCYTINSVSTTLVCSFFSLSFSLFVALFARKELGKYPAFPTLYSQ